MRTEFRSATLTEPVVEALSPRTARNAPPMVTATVMTGLPAFVRETFGPNALNRAQQATLLDIEMIERLDCFIPQTVVTTFLDTVERSAGEPNVGLIIAPNVSFSDLGLWGEYVLAADTLRAALVRAASSMDFHCTGDEIGLLINGQMAQLRYVSAVRGRPGYTHVACAMAAWMLSVFRHYLPSGWQPRMIRLDVPRPCSATPFDDTFSCPVVFDAREISIIFDTHLLDQPAPRSRARLLTLEDVARSRLAPANLDRLPDAVAAHIWAQVLTGAVSIESTAQAFDMSVRSLQRGLNREGIEFRTLTNAIRVRRAKELLEGTNASLTEISTALGYSTPASFTRTFRKATEVVPKEFRRVAWSAAGLQRRRPR